MKFKVLLLTAATLMTLVGETRGMRPRGVATEYPAYAAQNGIQVAAQALDPDQVKRLFATDVYKQYIVIEVAVYPGSSTPNLHDVDFTLRLNGQSTSIRPATPEAVAASLTRPSKSDNVTPRGRDIAIYPTAEIGYESGGYDPVTGRRRSGVYTGGGVGVGVGSPGPAGPPPDVYDRNRSTMEAELTDKSLPDGRITNPVAGYLYFPLPSGKKKYTVSTLEFRGDDASIEVIFPGPRKH